MEKKWLQYWRNSLADGDRLQVNISKAVAKADFDLICLQTGQLPEVLVEALFKAKEADLNKKLKKRKKDDFIKLREIDVALAPFCIISGVEHGIHLGVEQHIDPIYPFWIPAVLSREEGLLPPEYPLPRVIRSVLEPILTEGSSLTISTVEKVDEALEEGRWEYPDWQAYWEYCQQFFKAITDKSLSAYKLSGHSVQHQGLIITDDQVRGASHNIIRLYDNLRFRSKLPSLLTTYIRCKSKVSNSLLNQKRQDELAFEHVGYMNQAFSLSPSQRTSLHHLCALKGGELLAVNGPPGTGKTTLLQAVVANMFVSYAITGNHPPVIVATSTNNQAVTNIIDSFSKAQSNLGQLAERWLPDVNSYAMYLPATRKWVPEDISFTKVKGGGLPAHIEHKAYWEDASEYFLEQCYIYSEETFENPSQAADWLRHQLMEVQRHIDDVLHAVELVDLLKQKLEAYGSQAYQRLFVASILNTGKLEKEITLLAAIIDRSDRFLALVDDFQSLSSIFYEWDQLKNLCPFRLPDSWTNIQNQIAIKELLVQFQALSYKKLHLLKDAKLAASAYRNWQEESEHYECVLRANHYLDTSPRHKAFLLATHYWEARWLMDIEPLLEGDLLRRNGKGAMEKRWRRYAMLTPCFVSTFFMLPRFFQFTFYNEGYETSPMLNFIDLLIVDEAGQVSPEVAGASFALAKKALIVGDIYQIQPIWKIPRHIDFANVERFKLIGDGNDIPGFNQLFRKGMLASSGSVMRIALKISAYNLPSRPEGGLFLTEHRRCYDEIIGYCNQLAYRGALIPKRGKSPQKLFPPFGYYYIPGKSQSSGGSRQNMVEAQEIGAWLNTHRAQIEDFYKDQYEEIEEIVGVLTPFAAQSRTLRQVLKDYQMDIRKMKIGTIHSLQGAERPIIIFSSVYGGNNIGMNYFFDVNVHMLNVAVSRAQDSFLLFGDMRIMNPDSGTPSGLLATYLKRFSHNNLKTWQMFLGEISNTS